MMLNSTRDTLHGHIYCCIMPESQQPPLRKRITLGSRSISYLEAGAGDPVVLLHAFPLNADMWSPQLTGLSGSWRLVLPDFRGFEPVDVPGEDRREPARQQPLAASVDDYAADVIDLLEALKIKEAVIGGLSMGGYITFALLRRAARYFRALILADTRSQADSEEARAARVKLRALVDRGGAPAVAREMLPKLLTVESLRTRPDLVSVVRGMIERADPAAIKAALGCLMTRPDATPLLSNIHCPTLVIVGEHDAITPPSEAEMIHRQIAGSQLAVIPEAGHLSNLERPNGFNAAVSSFLKESL